MRKHNFNNLQGGRFPAVVGSALKSAAEDGYRRIFLVRDHIKYAFGHIDFTAFVAFYGGFNQRQVNAVEFTHISHGVRILREAETAVAGAGNEEFGTDTAVQSHALGDFINVCARCFAKVGHLVNILDFHGEKGV